jgi:hypothetical protein
MPKAKTDEYNEIKEIRDNLDSLKSNVIALTRHLSKDSAEKAVGLTEELKKSTFKAAGKLVAKGEREMNHLEKHVKSNPGKSMLLAFATGMAASIFLNRK